MGRLLKTVPLEEQWKELVMFRPEAVETHDSSLSLQLFEGESYANRSTFILCSPAAQELRSVCRNYK